MKRSAIRDLLRVAIQPGVISFAGGLPAPELFPVQEAGDAVDRVLARHGSTALQYGESEGVRELREWIAAHVSTPDRAISAEEVLVTSGAQQALDLVGRVFLEEGDRVAVEKPTYLALLTAWGPQGVVFVDGPESCILRGTAFSPIPPKLIYSIPNFQNPSGRTLDLASRSELVGYSRRHSVVLIEDNAYGQLRYDGAAIPDLAELDARMGAGRVTLQVGTFSKILAPGFRVGWIVAPTEVQERLVRARQSMDLHTSGFNQHVVLEMAKSGVLEVQIPKLRTEYRRRRDAMQSALRQHLPGARWKSPDGGMFIFAHLSGGMDGMSLLGHALKRQVAFVPGREFHFDGSGANTIRLNFTHVCPDKIAEGIRRLADAVRKLEESSETGG